MAAVITREMLARDVKGEIKLLPEDRQKLMEIIDAANRDRREMLSEHGSGGRRRTGNSIRSGICSIRAIREGRRSFLAAMKKAGMKAR